MLETWLRAVTYRPGVTFEIGDGTLDIRVHTIDSRSPRDDLREIDITHRTAIPVFDTRLPEAQLRSEFLEFVRECALAIERHESHEWFRVNGRVVIDPHALDVLRLP